MTACRARLVARTPDVLGVAWVVVAALAVLVPALHHGASLGPFDLLSRYGLSQRPGVVVHYTGPGDQIEQMIPWTNLAWTQVHHGHLPLWNPYSELGMPLVFNWQSSAFSVPSALGYLFPLRLAYTVAQVTTLVIAGTGVYAFGRVLRLGVLGAVTAGTVYELSGPFMGWLGWPNAGAMAFAGWVFAAALLVVSGRRRALHILFLAIALAAAIYAGQPEAVVLLSLSLGVFLLVFLALRARKSGVRPPVLRPVFDVVVAGVAGAALSAPLALPGLQVASASIVRVVSRYGALPPHDLTHLLFQGFDGLPVSGSRWFGNSIYPETAAYVGAIALALGVLGVARRWRRPEVPALAAVVVLTAAIAFAKPVVSLINTVTGLPSVAWHRSLLQLTFALAVLAGVGMDTLVRSYSERGVLGWTGVGFAATGVAVALVWFVGRGRLPAPEAAIRTRSFLWPVISIAVGLGVAGALALTCRGRRARHAMGAASPPFGRWAGLALLVCETVFLVGAGAPLVSSSPTPLAPTAAEAALQRAVGPALVAFGTRDCHIPPTLGIHQDVNVAFSVHELSTYDPMTPQTTFEAFAAATGQPADALGAHLILCPAITDAAVARRYGIGYVLEPRAGPGPRGARYDRTVGDESLYLIPDAASATLVPLAAGGALPSLDAAGTPLAVAHPGPASWRLHTTTNESGVLRLRLTDVPGWHATLDGQNLPLMRFAGLMLQARIPPGRHTIELSYWPTAFTVGIVLALTALAGLALALLLQGFRRRHVRAAPRPL